MAEIDYNSPIYGDDGRIIGYNLVEPIDPPPVPYVAPAGPTFDDSLPVGKHSHVYDGADLPAGPKFSHSELKSEIAAATGKQESDIDICSAYDMDDNINQVRVVISDDVDRATVLPIVSAHSAIKSDKELATENNPLTRLDSLEARVTALENA